MSPRQLTEQQQLRLLAMRVLCQYCDMERAAVTSSERDAVTSSTRDFQPILEPKVVKRDLLTLLEEDQGWDCTKPFDLQLVRI